MAVSNNFLFGVLMPCQYVRRGFKGAEPDHRSEHCLFERSRTIAAKRRSKRGTATASNDCSSISTKGPNMVKVALYVHLDAKPGREAEVEKFLQGGQAARLAGSGSV